MNNWGYFHVISYFASLFVLAITYLGYFLDISDFASPLQTVAHVGPWVPRVPLLTASTSSVKEPGRLPTSLFRTSSTAAMRAPVMVVDSLVSMNMLIRKAFRMKLATTTRPKTRVSTILRVHHLFRRIQLSIKTIFLGVYILIPIIMGMPVLVVQNLYTEVAPWSFNSLAWIWNRNIKYF